MSLENEGKRFLRENRYLRPEIPYMVNKCYFCNTKNIMTYRTVRLSKKVTKRYHRCRDEICLGRFCTVERMDT